MGCHHSKMGTRAVEQGPVGEAVAVNVRQVRERRRLSQQQLASKMGDLGRPVQASTIAKIEGGDRRVDVDDLLVLAVALNVAPARLLVPDTGMDDEVAITKSVRMPGWSVWAWANGEHSLSSEEDDINDPVVAQRDLDFVAERPLWKRRQDDHPLARAQARLGWTVRRLIGVLPGYGGDRTTRVKGLEERWIGSANHALDGVRRELDQLGDEV